MDEADLDEDRAETQDEAVSALETAIGEHQGAKADGPEEQSAPTD